MNGKKSIDQKLAEDGWARRFIAGEPRLSESVLAYQEAGFETRVEPLPRTDRKTCADKVNHIECRICFDGHEDEYKIIYTRPKREKSENDLP